MVYSQVTLKILPWVRKCLNSVNTWEYISIASVPKDSALFPCMWCKSDLRILSMDGKSSHPLLDESKFLSIEAILMVSQKSSQDYCKHVENSSVLPELIVACSIYCVDSKKCKQIKIWLFWPSKVWFHNLLILAKLYLIF
jgi:hypothetical protein